LRTAAALLAAAAVALLLAQAPPPAQPIPYSHKKHVAMGLQCAQCHENADPGEWMGLPATAKCMSCHKAVKKDSPHIQKLAAFHESSRPVPWVRVYEIPSYVFFSHRAHIAAGGTCQGCHGDVAQMEAVFKAADISMGACMECHRKNKASIDCQFCHEARN
jgi:hypothetical protein